MIKLSNISLQLGGKSLLDDTSVTFNTGERIAVIGANGTGKTTLFKVLQNELQVDAGTVEVPKHWRLSHMKQEIAEVDRSALDFVLDGDQPLRQLQRALTEAENKHDDDAMAQALGALDTYHAFEKQNQAEQLLAGLGFNVNEFAKPVGEFSGGWRVRLNLARALMCPSDLLLLDEPTNHLDLHTCYWLEQWLKQYPGTLLLISHDRDFMDGVATQVVSFEQQKLIGYRGNYSQYERQKGERLAQQQQAFDKQQQQKEHLESFVRRFKAKASKAKQAQSRVKMLEKLTLTAPASISYQYNITIPTGGRVSDPVVSLDNVDLGYATNQPILKNVNVSLQPGSRLGLLGVNGAGKSTLIKAIVGDLIPQSGEVIRGHNLRIGYFAQHQLESLDEQASPFLHLRRLDADASDQVLKNFVGRFGFSGERADEAIVNFSGGEKARVALAMIAWQKPNLLLLDEPTNHLDLEMRESLNIALQEYDGAVILVSHDRYMLNSTADEFWWVRNGQVEQYEGDLEDYFQALLKAPNAVPASADQGADLVNDKKAQRQARAAEREKLKPLLSAFKKAEARLDKAQQKLVEVETQLADPTLYEADNKSKLQPLLKEQGQLKTEVEAVELEWLDLSEQIEQAQAS
ncbi:ATP-binding cassette domain-containing protein [Reinekea marina]|uniref:ATP-binding cassette domain-containing protein n=1 Tax=Reinekea marina TaxID=1310421 RepID=A0ABV7WRL7_9GAMM|nr:ATP-binding cassette domain-containing protein [Reinekea marina]MDN3647643.1 ATP-binding cassette domain-containing protein [Reinekea marina]